MLPLKKMNKIGRVIVALSPTFNLPNQNVNILFIQYFYFSFKEL